MAREECHREDLLREATALVERIELARIGSESADHIVVGFRTGGAASFFFGEDPVYQFNADGELRRAFFGGQLIKAVRGRLVTLSRQRLQAETQLLSRDLSDAEQRDFIATMTARLRDFAAGLQANRYSIVGQVPAN